MLKGPIPALPCMVKKPPRTRPARTQHPDHAPPTEVPPANRKTGNTAPQTLAPTYRATDIPHRHTGHTVPHTSDLFTEQKVPHTPRHPRRAQESHNRDQSDEPLQNGSEAPKTNHHLVAPNIPNIPCRTLLICSPNKKYRTPLDIRDVPKKVITEIKATNPSRTAQKHPKQTTISSPLTYRTYRAAHF